MERAPRRRQRAPAKKTPRADGTCTLVRYTPEIAAEICERLAQGEVWSRICNTGRMPSYATLYAWRDRHPEFGEALARAREMAADYFADRVVEVAEGATSATASGDRIRVGALQWRAAKAFPPRYGRKAEDQVAPRKIILEVRKFEKAIGPDGKTYLREIPKLPEGGDER